MVVIGILLILIIIFLTIIYIRLNERHNNLLRSIVTPICIINRDARVVKILNKTYVATSPFSMNQPENMDFLSILDNEHDIEKFKKCINEVIDGKELMYDEQFSIKDNRGKHYHVMLHIIYYANNTAYVYLFNSIEEKNTSKDLSKLVETVFDSINIPISVRDLANKLEYKYWNKEAEDLFGISRKSVLGKSDTEFIGKDVGNTIDRNALNSKDNLIYPIDNKNGKIYALTVSQNRIETKNNNLLITCFIDNSAMNAKEDALKCLTSLSRLMMDKADIDIWIWNIKEKTIARCSDNLKFPEEINMTMSEDSVRKSIKSEDMPRFVAIINSIREGKSSELNIEFEMLKNENKYSWAKTYALVYERDNDGKPTSLIGVTFNIDKIKHLEILAKESENAKNMRNREKSTLLTNISYVINNPLNSIIGYSQLLEVENDPQVRKEYVRNLQQDSASLLNKINIMLQISNIKSGTATFIKQPIDLNGLIIECCDLAKSQNLNDNITIKKDIPVTTTTLMMDNRYLTKVINNLVANAMKYTFNGTITIGYNKYSDKKVNVFVKDTGCGIPQDKAKSLFDKFYDNNAITNTSNSGLGLPLCKAIVERLGGEIGVNSELGKGSEFWFTINTGY